MKAKANLNVKDNYNDTPLKWARASGHRDSFEAAMRKNGKKVSYTYITDDMEAFVRAAEEGKTIKFKNNVLIRLRIHIFIEKIYFLLANTFRKYGNSSRTSQIFRYQRT